MVLAGLKAVKEKHAAASQISASELTWGVSMAIAIVLIVMVGLFAVGGLLPANHDIKVIR